MQEETAGRRALQPRGHPFYNAGTMTPAEFVRKWAASKGGERAVAQKHFIDICRLLGEQTPSEADPSSDFYAFEKGARRPDGEGFADVWLKGHFAWEYKGKRKDLTAAYKQVSDYREAPGNPPLLIVCDIDRFEVHTNWTNTENWVYRFANTNLLSDERVQVSTASGSATDAPSLTARARVVGAQNDSWGGRVGLSVPIRVHLWQENVSGHGTRRRRGSPLTGSG